MDHVYVAIEIAKLRPHWPTHTIAAILDRAETKWITDDPRTRSADMAEQLVRFWDERAQPLPALQRLVAALVSPAVKDSELPALFANTPDAGAIVPALIDARAAIAKATGA